MGAAIVVLYLTVWNTDTGILLWKGRYQMPDFSVSGNRIEDCRIFGVDEAKHLAEHYRTKYPNATANVDCQWERETEPA